MLDYPLATTCRTDLQHARADTLPRLFHLMGRGTGALSPTSCLLPPEAALGSN